MFILKLNELQGGYPFNVSMVILQYNDTCTKRWLTFQNIFMFYI